MSREQVLGEQQLTGTTLEASKVDSAPLEGHATVFEAADLSDRYEEVTAFDADDRTNDGRVSVVAEPRDQVLDASNPVTFAIEDRSVQER